MVSSVARPAAWLRRAILLALLTATGACTVGQDRLSEVERRAIADTLEAAIRGAYDLSAPPSGAVDRLLSLYPPRGRVVSASGGQILTSRDSLAEGIRFFWETAGRNMRSPRWIWEEFVTDVLGPNAAVVTATYRVPHVTPQGRPHELAGAMTLVFRRRDARWSVIQEHLSDRPPTGQPPDTAHQHDEPPR